MGGFLVAGASGPTIAAETVEEVVRTELASPHTPTAHAALTRIYPTIIGPMWQAALAAARQYMGTPEDAQDALQEVMAGLREKVRSGKYTRRANGSFVAWCCTLVRNRVRDRLKGRRGAARSTDTLGAEAALAAAQPWADPERHTELALAAARIARLPPEKRELLILRSQGYSYDEIGVRLGIGAPTARKHYERTLKALSRRPKSERSEQIDSPPRDPLP